MENLQLATSENFCGALCDFYCVNNQLFMTRSQIGKALEYEKEAESIGDIHNRYKARLDKFSVQRKLSGTDGKLYSTYLYSQRGVFEICRRSRQAKADAFMDWVWDVIEAYRNGDLQPKALNNESILCMQVNEIEKTMDNFYDRLNRLEDAFYHSEPAQRIAYITMNKPIIDPIRDTIEPLAKLYCDGSNGYNSTYRKVYEAMGCDWKNRRTRFKNGKGNKTSPSNIKLIEQDKKLLKLFVNTVDQLIRETQK